jgi:hypothetical protein
MIVATVPGTHNQAGSFSHFISCSSVTIVIWSTITPLTLWVEALLDHYPCCPSRCPFRFPFRSISFSTPALPFAPVALGRKELDTIMLAGTMVKAIIRNIVFPKNHVINIELCSGPCDASCDEKGTHLVNNVDDKNDNRPEMNSIWWVWVTGGGWVSAGCGWSSLVGSPMGLGSWWWSPREGEGWYCNFVSPANSAKFFSFLDDFQRNNENIG